MTPRCGSAGASGVSDSSAGSHTSGRKLPAGKHISRQTSAVTGEVSREKVSFSGGYDIPVVSVSHPCQLLSCINIKRRNIFCRAF